MMLGSSLFHARKRAGLTQEGVAERLGVSRQGIASLPYSYILSSLMSTVRSSSTASNPEREKNPYR